MRYVLPLVFAALFVGVLVFAILRGLGYLYPLPPFDDRVDAVNQWMTDALLYEPRATQYLGWLVVLATLPVAALALVRMERTRRREHRRAAGLCPACGYDLRASPERCPECGNDGNGRFGDCG